MKTREEIQIKLHSIQSGKSMAKINDDDEGYRAWCKAEKLLKWVLGK